MTAFGEDGTQWADYGVNVGGNVHGTINIYTASPTGATARPQAERVRRVSATDRKSVV